MGRVGADIADSPGPVPQLSSPVHVHDPPARSAAGVSKNPYREGGGLAMKGAGLHQERSGSDVGSPTDQVCRCSALVVSMHVDGADAVCL